MAHNVGFYNTTVRQYLDKYDKKWGELHLN